MEKPQRDRRRRSDVIAEPHTVLLPILTAADSDDDTSTTSVNPLADGPYAGQLQDALTSALTSGSGLGLAGQIYKEMQS